MNRAGSKRSRHCSGHTIVELLCASVVMGGVITGTMSFFSFYLRGWRSTEIVMYASQDASMALQRMTHCNQGQAGLMAASRNSTTLLEADGDWRIDYGDGQLLMYDADAGEIINENGSVICDNVVTSSAAVGPFGVQLALTVEEGARGRRYTSSMSTYIDFRN